MHIADFDKPRLGGPSVGRPWVFVEHGGGVVDFWTTVFALISDKALDCRAHPSEFAGSVGFQLSYPPVLIGIFIVA